MDLSAGICMTMMEGVEAEPINTEGPISFVGSAVQGAVGAAGTWSFSMSNLRDEANVQPTLQEHDFVMVFQAIGGQVDVSSLIEDPGSDLQLRIFKKVITTANMAHLLVYHKHLGAVPDASLTLPQSGDGASGLATAVYVFRGVDLITPFDVADTFNELAGSDSPNPPSITPATAGAWIVAAGAGASGIAPTLTNPANMSATTNHFRTVNGADNVDAALAVALKTDWASGAFDPGQFLGGTSNANHSRVGITMALKSAPLP